jgi:8-oxo-dGTP pyrophosphatase MutT (NUDIX family)
MSTERPAEPRLGAPGRDRGGPFERETSYGGVVVRGDDVLVITPRGKPVTGLPKGGAAAGETGEQAAVREVREETGVLARVIEPLGDVRYRYRRGGRRVHKTVHFYLCEFVRGSTADHDHEVDEARWISLQAARKALSYAGERALIERALSKLAGGR